jgi:hemoglobin
MERSRVLSIVGCLALLAGGAAHGATGDQVKAAKKKGPVEEIRAMESGCAATAADRQKRHAEAPLFQRLGGEEKIHAFTHEIVRLHRQNPEIGHYFAKSDPEVAARHAAEFMITGTGGPAVYKGPDLRTSHGRMGITNQDFVVAGKDIVQAMTNLGYGPNEIDEMVCTLVSLRDQVVREDQIALKD